MLACTVKIIEFSLLENFEAAGLTRNFQVHLTKKFKVQPTQCSQFILTELLESVKYVVLEYIK